MARWQRNRIVVIAYILRFDLRWFIQKKSPEQIFQFVISAFANTMPIPSGIFIPAMAMGAGIGRLVGEFVYLMFPNGLYGDVARLISPGVYAVIGQLNNLYQLGFIYLFRRSILHRRRYS